MKAKSTLLLVSLAFLIICGILVGLFYGARMKTRTSEQQLTLPNIDDVPPQCWAKLAEEKVFFGHQSVGFNIVEGINDILRGHDRIKLNIVVPQSPSEIQKGCFSHAQVGRNMDPDSKIKDFCNVVDDAFAEDGGIAFFKFCYVDIMRDSNPEKLFQQYKEAMDELKAKHPTTTFMHVTVPLKSRRKGAKKVLKGFVKWALRMPGVTEDNCRRQEYNKLLRDAYTDKEIVFDLAYIESVNNEGRPCYMLKGEQEVQCMAPEYTDDGGHLNPAGRRHVAEQLLITLAESTEGMAK